MPLFKLAIKPGQAYIGGGGGGGRHTVLQTHISSYCIKSLVLQALKDFKKSAQTSLGPRCLQRSHLFTLPAYIKHRKERPVVAISCHRIIL